MYVHSFLGFLQRVDVGQHSHGVKTHELNQCEQRTKLELHFHFTQIPAYLHRILDRIVTCKGVRVTKITYYSWDDWIY
jgi:hypothetical protein